MLHTLKMSQNLSQMFVLSFQFLVVLDGLILHHFKLLREDSESSKGG